MTHGLTNERTDERKEGWTDVTVEIVIQMYSGTSNKSAGMFINFQKKTHPTHPYTLRQTETPLKLPIITAHN